jgi:hypothetical protein
VIGEAGDSSTSELQDEDQEKRDDSVDESDDEDEQGGEFLVDKGLNLLQRLEDAIMK